MAKRQRGAREDRELEQVTARLSPEGLHIAKAEHREIRRHVVAMARLKEQVRELPADEQRLVFDYVFLRPFA